MPDSDDIPPHPGPEDDTHAPDPTADPPVTMTDTNSAPPPEATLTPGSAGRTGATGDWPPTGHPGTGLAPPPGYELLGLVGEGGMGAVYQARDTRVNRPVALKVLLDGRHARAEHRARFRAEAEAVAALNHPGVVGLYELGVWNGQPFLAMEFCPGGTLSRRLAGTPLPARDAADLVASLADAVAAAHARGVVHRDIKPGNVLFAADGRPKLADFGLAKLADAGDGLTRTGAVMGTPCYMAPEQARDSKAAGPAADVWALGAVLYECLTGRPPFKGVTDHATLMQVRAVDPVAVRALNPAVPADLETVCLKCLEKDPTRRYGSAAAVADDLRRLLDGRPVHARPVGPLGRAHRWARRNPAVAALLAVAFLSLAAGTGVSVVNYLEADRERRNATAEAGAKQVALEDAARHRTELERALSRVEREKDAAELAYLRGLLRPLVSYGPSRFARSVAATESFAALRDLVEMADERARFRVAEAVPASATGGWGAAAWRRELVWAVVGFDRGAAGRFRAAVGAALASEPAGSDRSLVLALWASELPPGADGLDGVAARILAARTVAAESDVEMYDLVASLDVLAGRLGAAEAAAVAGPPARRLAGRIAPPVSTAAQPSPARAGGMGAARDEATPTAWAANQIKLALGLDKLAGRLGPAEAASVAGPPARVLAARTAAQDIAAGSPEDISMSASFAPAFATLARRLGPAEVAAAARPAAESLVGRLGAVTDPDRMVPLAASLATLARCLGPAEAAAVVGPGVRALAGRAAAEADPHRLARLGRAVAILAGLLPAAEAEALTGPVARALAGRAEVEPDSFSGAGLGEAAASVARWLGPAEAGAVVGPVARSLAGRMRSEKDLARRTALGRAVAALAEVLDPADAAEPAGRAARVIATRMAAGRDGYEVWGMKDVVAGLAPRLGPADAAAVARDLAGGATAEVPPEQLACLGSALAAVAGRLSPGDAAAAVGPPAGVVAARIRSEVESRRHPQLHGLPASLAALAARLDPAEAAAVATPAARALADRASFGVWGPRSVEGHDVSTHIQVDVWLAEVAPCLRDADLLALLRTHGIVSGVQYAVTAEFARRRWPARSFAHAAAVGWPVVSGVQPPPFADVWGFVAWAEANRPDLDLTSRPARP